MIVFKPYKNGLKGLGLVKQKIRDLGAKCIEVKLINSKYKEKVRDKVVRWGVAKSKTQQYHAFRQSNLPVSDWTSQRESAASWIRDGYVVLCRTVLNGHGGAGITVARTVDQLIDAPLYVKYTKKRREFRVHVCNGTAYIREKKMVARERRPENFNMLVRNHDNGWVFCRTQLHDPLYVGLVELAGKAIQSLGLDMGAVDLGWNEVTGFNLYEVNTAPGCDNNTAMFYALALLGRGDELGNFINLDAEGEQ